MRPIIIAHRGASNLAPENTLAAFRLAKRLGADGIECDVQLTKDHQLVIAHDYFTDDHTGVKGDIYDMTLAELRQLDFGKWKSPEYEGEKIPTLDEVLEVGRDMKMLHIELKPTWTGTPISPSGWWKPSATPTWRIRSCSPPSSTACWAASRRSGPRSKRRPCF